jgi:hypothetical protein
MPPLPLVPELFITAPPLVGEENEGYHPHQYISIHRTFFSVPTQHAIG